MKQLPITTASPLLRTDFSDPAAWDAIRSEIDTPSAEGFQAQVEAINDRAFENFTVQGLLKAVPADYPHSFIIVADRSAMDAADRTLLVVNLDGEGNGRTFRAVIGEMWAVENNLSIANLDFDDFANAVDSAGVYRGEI